MPVSVRSAFSVVSLCVTLAFPGMRELVRCLVVVLDFRCTESLNRIKHFFVKAFFQLHPPPLSNKIAPILFEVRAAVYRLTRFRISFVR